MNEPGHSGSHGGALAPAQELEVALATAASYQMAAQQADGKVALLGVVHAGLTMAVITNAKAALAPERGWLVLVMVMVGQLVWLLVATAATYRLLAALRPRLTSPAGENRFAFPALARAPAPPAVGGSAEEMCAHAWALVARLSEIALAKHQHVASALRWLAIMVATGVPWLLLLTLLG